MERLNDYRMRLVVVGWVAAVVLGGGTANAATFNQAPIADAGLARYAAIGPVVLDGTGSYDPDNSGPLSYTWRQVSARSEHIVDANTATPTVSGFVQTHEIQECEFELVVSDGDLTSLPDSVKVIIVPDFGVNKLIHLNPPFDPNKPTLAAFGGAGGCQNIKDGTYLTNYEEWRAIANFISFGNFHASIYKDLGDMFIVYLSSQAPDYQQPIQTFGHSAGGEPAIDIAIYLNETYADRRYAVNHVTLIDSAGYCRDYSGSIERFLASAVEGEQCWIDSYSSTLPGAYGQKMDFGFQANALNVWFDRTTDNSFTHQQNHQLSKKWYRESLTGSDMNEFNNGVVAGAYWSVIGPGKNLQLASTPGVETYKFTWYGDELSGYMDLYDEPNHPGRLPEPVRLLDPVVIQGFGAVFTCEESENAVGYELLMGSDPYRVMDFNIISDTPTPPRGAIEEVPYEETWWTIRVRDQYGSTIYADPTRVNLESLVDANHPTLIAYWPLDETEGNTAYDEAGENHAFVYGNAAWLPSGGMFSGALQLDGADDWAYTSLYQSLGEGPFSLVAWVKGGASNQAVMSQPLAADWLVADAKGRLMTELGGMGPLGKPLTSGTDITDGDWHQIGVLLDGAHRSLYIDGVTVAEDSQADSGVPDVSINIGVGKNYLPGTYWSGLIDDVRIYNRAVKP